MRRVSKLLATAGVLAAGQAAVGQNLTDITGDLQSIVGTGLSGVVLFGIFLWLVVRFALGAGRG